MKKTLGLLIAAVLLAGTAHAAKPKKGNGKYADINGLKMYYEVQGKGAPLVLLHGGIVTLETSWEKTRPAFNKKFKTIAPEFQAHGHTGDVKDRPFTMEQWAEDVYALLKEQKVEKADFFGWSMGGGVALMLASKHPEMVRKVAVSGTALTKEGMVDGQDKAMAGITVDMFPPDWKKEYAAKNPDTAGFANLLDKVKAFSAAWKPMKAEEIKAIKAPVLFIIGDADIVKPQHAAEVAKMLPHVKLAILPMTDHFAPVSRAAWVQEMVTEFLQAPMPDSASPAKAGEAPKK